MTDLTEGYVCASCDARPDSKCFRHGEKWLCGTCFDEARIAEKDADLAALRERLAAAEAELADLRHFKETRTTHATLKKRAETAEALARELAAVAKAAEGYVASFQEEDALEAGRRYAVIVSALAALSPAARKEIEG